MKRTTQLYILVLAFALGLQTVLAETPTPELQKWLKFHGLEEATFEQVGPETRLSIYWQIYSTRSIIEDYLPFMIHSTNHAHFIDLHSYTLDIRSQDGNYYCHGSELYTKVQLVRTTDTSSATVLYCEFECFTEEAAWTSNTTFELYCFSFNDMGDYVPTKWFYDLEKKVYSKQESKTILKSLSKNYVREERLKAVKFY